MELGGTGPGVEVQVSAKFLVKHALKNKYILTEHSASSSKIYLKRISTEFLYITYENMI